MKIDEEILPGMRLRAIYRGHTDVITRISWSPCGRFLASPSRDKTIRIWDTQHGECIKELSAHSEQIVSTTWSSDGSTLCSVSGDFDDESDLLECQICFWRTKDWKLQQMFPINSFPFDAKFSPVTSDLIVACGFGA